MARLSYSRLAKAKRTMTSKNLLPLLAVALLPTTGCFFQGYDGVFIESRDVTLDMPQDEEFRTDGQEGLHGDVYQVVTYTATDVNAWVTAVVEGSSFVVQFVNQYRETSRDGEWRVYGPVDSTSTDQLAWLVKVTGDSNATSFEFYCAPRGTKNPADFDLLIAGGLNAAGDMRDGDLLIDFDTVEKYDALKDPGDILNTFGGKIEITFERDVETEAKHINLEFVDFTVEHEGYLDDDSFFSDESYDYQRNADGSGSFFLALWGEWDTYGWSGPEMERMQLDARWSESGEGRTRGTVTDGEGGDMKHGDLRVDECYDESGWLYYREINEPYMIEVPEGYNFGTQEDCVFSDEDLG
jgi:hypothetical protein